MQISEMKDLHSGSYQKKSRSLGYMQVDHTFAVFSIQDWNFHIHSNFHILFVFQTHAI